MELCLAVSFVYDSFPAVQFICFVHFPISIFYIFRKLVFCEMYFKYFSWLVLLKRNLFSVFSPHVANCNFMWSNLQFLCFDLICLESSSLVQKFLNILKQITFPSGTVSFLFFFLIFTHISDSSAFNFLMRSC